jgi:dephospho-CoA kinase
MKKIGVTGGIASGKSLICRILEEIGHPVFYSDRVAKDIIRTDNVIKRQIIELFGEASYFGDQLIASHIASLAFTDPLLLDKMNQIIHPAVRRVFDVWCEKQNKHIVFNEAAILFETGAYRKFDATLLVTAPMEIRIKRAMFRDNSCREEVTQRISKQWPDEKKIPLASYVLNNDDATPIIKQLEDFLIMMS